MCVVCLFAPGAGSSSGHVVCESCNATDSVVECAAPLDPQEPSLRSTIILEELSQWPTLQVKQSDSCDTPVSSDEECDSPALSCTASESCCQSDDPHWNELTPCLTADCACALVDSLRQFGFVDTDFVDPLMLLNFVLELFKASPGAQVQFLPSLSCTFDCDDENASDEIEGMITDYVRKVLEQEELILHD